MSCCRVFRINNDVKKRIVVAFGRYQPPHCGHKTIFDDQKFIKNITLTISKYINPKKSRKEFLIKTVREIIKELKISSNSVNKG